MEKINPEQKPNFDEQFDKLAYGEYMELPMSMIHPITIDDYKDPETEDDKPWDVFKKKDEVNIDDGNHRYFKKLRKLFAKNNYEDPDLSKVMVKIRKIDPEKAINSWILKY